MTVLMVVMAACGAASTPEEVIKKYDEGKDLKSSEYEVLIEYAEKYLDETGKIISTTSDPTQMINAATELEKRYPQAEGSFRVLIQDRQSGKMDEETSKKFDSTMDKFEKILQEASAGAAGVEG